MMKEETESRKKTNVLVSRRKLIQGLGGGALAAAAAVTLPSLGCQVPAQQREWSSSYDWICIGSGVAGLASAIFGHDKGLKSLVVEKLDKVGGLTSSSGGTMWIPMNRFMREKGIGDSREDAMGYLRYISGGYSRQEFMEAYVDNASKALDYLEQKADFHVAMNESSEFYYPQAPGSRNGGRNLSPEPFPSETLGAWRDKVLQAPYYRGFAAGPGGTAAEGGVGPARSATRSLEVWRKVMGPKLDAILKENDEYRMGGAAVSAYLFRAVLKRGIDVRTQTKVERLLSENGRVTGVVVTQNGKQEYIKANRGVVLATGGMFNRDWPQYGREWKLAAEVGALVANNPPVIPQIYVQVPDEKFGIGVPAGRSNYEMRMPHSLAVNRFGERFGNEAFFEDIGPKLVEFDNFGAHRYQNYPLYLIFDHSLVEKNGFGGMPPGYTESLDWVSQGKTLGELASNMKIPGPKLEATVSRFNELVRRGKDTDFKRDAKTLGPVEKAPFYGVQLTTMDPFFAGSTVQTETHGQVLAWRDDKPIPGFYALGAIGAIGKIWGIGYQGGFNIGSTLSFAMLAAEHAASEKA